MTHLLISRSVVIILDRSALEIQTWIRIMIEYGTFKWPRCRGHLTEHIQNKLHGAAAKRGEKPTIPCDQSVLRSEPFSWHTCLSCVDRAGFNKLLKPLRMLNHRCGANEKEEQEDNVRLQYQVMVVIHDVHSPKRRRRFGCAFRRRCCCHCCSKLNHDCTFGLSNLRRIRMILTYERRIGLHG